MSSIISESSVVDSSSGCQNCTIQRCKSPALSKIASSASISSIASFTVYDVNSSINVSELKERLSQLTKEKGQDLIQACKNFDRRSTSKIPKSQLKQVIRMFCVPISAAQFDCLCEELHMNTGGKINYYDFFFQLSGSKIPKINKSLQKIPDNLPIDEVELMIKGKVKDNLRDVIRSFWLFDINKDGFIQKTEMRRIIRNYCFDLSNNVFDDLWKSYDPKASGIISYKDFLIKLGISADRYQKYMPNATAASSLCWKENKNGGASFSRNYEQKCKRAALENRDDPAIQGLPLEEIVIIFFDRLCKQYEVLKHTFTVFDYEKKGIISLSDFRGVINFFVLAMSSSLFNRVMKKLDIDVSADGLDYRIFLENFCKSDYQSSSSRKSQKVDAVCAPVVRRIKNSVLNPEARLRSVFTKINTDKEWQVTRPELKKALELGLNFKLTDDEFKDLTMILDPGNTNVINCADFIRLFENSLNTIHSEGDNASEPSKKVNIEKYRNLCGYKLNSKLKHHLNKNLNNIEKAILVSDSDQSGFILPETLKNVLSTFCFPLSDDQFEEIASNIRRYGNNINYHEFLTIFKKTPDEDTKKWISVVDKLVDFKSKCSPEMLVSEVEEMLRDCTQSRKTAMLKDFKALDVCNVGVVCKDDFRNILSKFAFRLTDSQFEAVWETFPRNKYNQLLYDKFLENYSIPKVQPLDNEAEKKNVHNQDQSSMKNETKKKVSIQESERETASGGRRDKVVKSVENRKTTKEIFYSRAPQLKKIFESMEPTIIRNFRTIRFHLRRADPKVTDMVDFVTLKSILAKSGIYFSNEDEFHILQYFDAYLAGKINYRDFLRIFVWYA